MVYLFDTSGINHLHDDPARDAVVTCLTATNEVWVSALNVAEASCTPDSTRRESLLRLLKTLTQNRRPLETPPFLIRRALEAYSRGYTSLSVSIGTENEGVWQVLNAPTQFDEDYRQEVSNILRELEQEFITIHRYGRPHLQEALTNDQETPRSAADFIRSYAANVDLLHDAVSQFYEDVVGEPLPKARTMDLLRTLPQLTGFLLSWGHSIYRRGIVQSGYGKNNAGNVDIWFAVYLAHIHRFITNDRKQYQALRLVRRMYAPDCEVLLYDSFRKRLVMDSGA